MREQCDVKAVRKIPNRDRDGRQSCHDTHLVKRIVFAAVAFEDECDRLRISWPSLRTAGPPLLTPHLS